MSLLTEDEAKTKWCPLARASDLADLPVSVNRRGKEPDTDCMCIASACMAWPAAKECLVYSVPEAGKLLGLSTNAAYLAAKRGDIPTLKIGTLRRVPKAALHAMLVPTPSPQLSSKDA